MITQENLQPIFSDINPNNKTVSIAIDTVIKKDGEILTVSRHRRAFVPGEIEEVKEYIGKTDSPEISYLESLWTQEVIDNYKAQLAEQEE